jgi:F0F1-type ATP synthase membrane subunit b/b'
MLRLVIAVAVFGLLWYFLWRWVWRKRIDYFFKDSDNV